ncbi:MAG: GTP-binding protein [Methylobacter sp.]|uniref:CobW family GTP-binding protein n=1 Tax=Methylobacter sp. TaxID=2051955 RepID=UPI0025E9E669|nr:GTP-binding protein [Methylobacter sp.]MCK9621412.1 GTP-binding protein [Methylobacter sp.]
MPRKFTNIPTNMVMGFLGAGKTTAILNLLKQKPADEKWAVLVNEFGQVGIDGAIFAASDAIVKEVPGGCLCCAVGLPFQVAVNRLLTEVKPDRLLIEPTGLGHPKRVLDRLAEGYFRTVLDVRANICLVDPRKLSDSRYTSYENFVDQIALSDVLVANKMDLADKAATQLFERWADRSRPRKTVIAQTVQGQLDVAWLDLMRNPERQASFPNAHQTRSIHRTAETALENKNQLKSNAADGYQSYGTVFPEHSCFDYARTTRLLNNLEAERIKAVFATNKGWFIFNAVDGVMTIVPCKPSANSRIEIVATQNNCQDISTELSHCIVNRC